MGLELKAKRISKETEEILYVSNGYNTLNHLFQSHGRKKKKQQRMRRYGLEQYDGYKIVDK